MSALQNTLKISFVLFSLYSSTLYANNIYKWVDNKGNFTYSHQVPPDGQEVGRIDDIKKIVTYRPRPKTTMPTKEASQRARDLELAKLFQNSSATTNPLMDTESTCQQVDEQKKFDQ